MKDYLTSIEALNYHKYDWHSSSIDYSYKYPKEIKEWSNYGIDNNIANPIRAYLDYLYYNIKFLKRVPNMKINMFLFSEDEEKKILYLINTLLKRKLNSKELELLNLYKNYLKGGKYDFRSELYSKRKAQRERVKANRVNG